LAVEVAEESQEPQPLEPAAVLQEWLLPSQRVA
jgi:hypothetical protein